MRAERSRSGLRESLVAAFAAAATALRETRLTRQHDWNSGLDSDSDFVQIAFTPLSNACAVLVVVAAAACAVAAVAAPVAGTARWRDGIFLSDFNSTDMLFSQPRRTTSSLRDTSGELSKTCFEGEQTVPPAASRSRGAGARTLKFLLPSKERKTFYRHKN